MTPQAWPLWAVRRSTGQVYAVIGWNASGVAIGVEAGIELDGPQARPLDGVSFYTERVTVGKP